MADDDLQALGDSAQRNKNLYGYDYPDTSKLERIEAPDCVDRVVLTHQAWTGLCPKTGQPDSGKIEIGYLPGEFLVESKSLKLYLMGFRNYGSFGEFVVHRICVDLENLLDPYEITVWGYFDARGDIAIRASAVGGSLMKFSHE